MATRKKASPAHKPFSGEQQYLISEGDKLTAKLKEQVIMGLGKSGLEYQPKRHTYIYSGPGAGKTFTVATTADEFNVNIIKIQGAASMNNVAMRLAAAVYKAQGEEIVVWLDDVDSLLMDADNLNVMKAALDEETNLFVWQKNMTSQIASLYKNGKEDIAEALEHFCPEGTVGVEIPTDNVRFIITSNLPLAAPNLKANKTNTKKRMHEEAVMDRVMYVPFDLDYKQSWGWIASVLLKSNIRSLELDENQKYILLDWMYVNWKRLRSTSMRAVKDLAATMLNYPNDYPDHWNLMLTGER